MDRFLYCYNCKIGQMMKRIGKFPSGYEMYRCKNCKQVRDFQPIQSLPLDTDREIKYT